MFKVSLWVLLDDETFLDDVVCHFLLIERQISEMIALKIEVTDDTCTLRPD